jgi:hypothetical protein
MRNSRIAGLAFEQDGLITRIQALAAGASPDTIRHAITVARRWQVVVPGIYATFDGPLAQIHRLRTAVLFGGNRSMITGTMACRMIDLRYVPGPSDEIDILVDCSRHVTDVGLSKPTARPACPRSRGGWTRPPRAPPMITLLPSPGGSTAIHWLRTRGDGRYPSLQLLAHASTQSGSIPSH